MNRVIRLAKGIVTSTILVAAMVSQAAAFGGSYISISHDRGGRVIEYALKVKKIKETGREVRFRGKCDSACTLYLSLPSNQICIEPGANFGFHKAYGASPRGNQIATGYMMKKYPGWVRSWIRQRGGLSSTLKVMNYAYASQFVKPCDGGQNVRFAAVKPKPNKAPVATAAKRPSTAAKEVRTFALKGAVTGAFRKPTFDSVDTIWSANNGR